MVKKINTFFDRQKIKSYAIIETYRDNLRRKKGKNEVNENQKIIKI